MKAFRSESLMDEIVLNADSSYSWQYFRQIERDVPINVCHLLTRGEIVKALFGINDVWEEGDSEECTVVIIHLNIYDFCIFMVKEATSSHHGSTLNLHVLSSMLVSALPHPQ
ncbi:hypothetical protein PsorP6_010021 [Peronosclerospora sorghi]|uniref:Uncharacterized protein n=1 Tax=Peronosclerospora sorghi TaxID=230839 RepID=A0ACC0VWB2_9STRA|nr:hypothetical protein PsorP6_010021 [Peronosclerospora sorghi]